MLPQHKQKVPADQQVPLSENEIPAEIEEPEAFLCPITFKIMVDPVITPAGHSYERAAIEDWLGRSDRDPFTDATLKKEDLRPNLALKNAIENYKKVIAPLIQKITSLEQALAQQTQSNAELLQLTVSLNDELASQQEKTNSLEQALAHQTQNTEGFRSKAKVLDKKNSDQRIIYERTIESLQQEIASLKLNTKDFGPEDQIDENAMIKLMAENQNLKDVNASLKALLTGRQNQPSTQYHPHKSAAPRPRSSASLSANSFWGKSRDTPHLAPQANHQRKQPLLNPEQKEPRKDWVGVSHSQIFYQIHEYRETAKPASTTTNSSYPMWQADEKRRTQAAKERSGSQQRGQTTRATKDHSPRF